MPDNTLRVAIRLKVGVLTVSDRASRGEYEDLSGPAITNWLEKAIATPWEATSKIVPDELDQIIAALEELVDEEKCHLVLTTGGTGPARRDVTPEATLAVAHKELPGFGERMRAISLAYVPTAILSRQVGVIRDGSLIVNLPGSPRSIAEILDELFEAIPYCIELLEGPYVDTDPAVVTAFRPRKKS
ncbi:MAG: molybdopterin adenylyltransferase [Bradymonadaceae bacterium]